MTADLVVMGMLLGLMSVEAPLEMAAMLLNWPDTTQIEVQPVQPLAFVDSTVMIDQAQEASQVVVV